MELFITYLTKLVGISVVAFFVFRLIHAAFDYCYFIVDLKKKRYLYDHIHSVDDTVLNEINDARTIDTIQTFQKILRFGASPERIKKLKKLANDT